MAVAEIISFDKYYRANMVAKVNPPIMDANFEAPKISTYNPTVPLTLEEYTQIKNYFFCRENYFKNMCNNIRNFLYIVLSVNLAGRCGDIIKLRVCDVLNEDGTLKKYVCWMQEKTRAPQSVLINSISQDALVKYFSELGTYKMSDWLIPNFKRPGEHMTVDGMRKALKRACADLEICQDKHIGTHSLRKTYDNVALTRDSSQKNIVFAAKHLGHIAVNDKNLLRYIGMEQAEYDKYIEENGI